MLRAVVEVVTVVDVNVDDVEIADVANVTEVEIVVSRELDIKLVIFIAHDIKAVWIARMAPSRSTGAAL